MIPVSYFDIPSRKDCSDMTTGKKWDEVRRAYLNQMTQLDALHKEVEQSLERLRIETEHFREVDEAIRTQRETLSSTFVDLERKQAHFVGKGELRVWDISYGLLMEWVIVQAVLDEANRSFLPTDKQDAQV